MHIPHISIKLSFWNKGCNRVYDNNIYRIGTNKHFSNIKCLLAIIWLRNNQIINVNTQSSC